MRDALKGESLPEQEVTVLQEEEPIAPPPKPEMLKTKQPEPIIEKRRTRPRGKRSDPNYEQVGAYIPKTLNKKVKRLLIDEDGDFSDLVTKLLEDWVEQSSS
jgi:hypothetical protein